MALLSTVERLLNRHISESTAATRRLAALEGRSFAVTVDGPDLRIVLGVRDGRVAVRASADEAADATLRGTPLALLGLLDKSSLSRLRAQRVELAGNIHVAEEFAEMLRHARPDLEGELASWIGDIAAHEVGARLRSVRAWAARSHRSLAADLADYVQYERAILPAALEARAFYADVERLRDDVERAERRLERLARREPKGA
ncbi:MAG TPA: SCP2 sterol-binding domain-containing protein [Gammaproteobacteria bacterium]